MKIISSRPATAYRTTSTAQMYRDSEEVVRAPKPRLQDDSLSAPADSGILTVQNIIHGLLLNEFPVAREIAIQTYSKDWFDKETNVPFLQSLALALGDTFGIDGFRNVVWDTISGKNTNE